MNGDWDTRSQNLEYLGDSPPGTRLGDRDGPRDIMGVGRGCETVHTVSDIMSRIEISRIAYLGRYSCGINVHSKRHQPNGQPTVSPVLKGYPLTVIVVCPRSAGCPA